MAAATSEFPVPLDEFGSFSCVPPRYIRPFLERPSTASPPHHHLSSSIPVIALPPSASPPSAPLLLRQIELACQEWGFFQVTNHGISDALLDRVRSVSREFFDLPMEEKKKCALEAGRMQGFGPQTLHAESLTLDWGHLFSLMHSPSFLGYGNVWPATPPEFRETLEDFSNELAIVAQRLLRLIAESLGLSENYFIDAYGEHVSQTMRINYYPPCPQPDVVLGLTSHADASGITLLLQDGIEGLQVLKDGEWTQVNLIQNALVINIGDQLEVITNGRYKSVEHRAVTNDQKSRISWATFYNPSWEATIFPAPHFVDESHPALYRHFKSADFMRNFLNQKLEGRKAIDFVKIKPS